jgi:RimJ/RimL family protein N-acetyltransferase
MPIPGAQHHWPTAPHGRTVTLADGGHAVVRTLAAGEVAVVQQVFDGLSERSRYERFLGAKPTLSRDDLALLSAVDHDNHEVLVAVDPVTGSAVAEAHLVRDRCDRSVAEVAFAVADDWQGRCLGTRLASLLAARARELGIHRVHASMLSGNTRSRALMRRMGRVVNRSYEGAAIELEVVLD